MNLLQSIDHMSHFHIGDTGPNCQPQEWMVKDGQGWSNLGRRVAICATHLQDVNRIYRQFSGFVKQNRPNIDIEAVAMDAMAGF